MENMNTIPRHHRHLRSQPFRFLDLPTELRLKIYRYLLPPRTHTIVTNIPSNGYYLNATTVPTQAAHSFCPFERRFLSERKQTTYKIIPPDPWALPCPPPIYPEIFRACNKVHYEAEPALYGDKDTIFDFGTDIEALMAFMGDRSKTARDCVRNVRIATMVPPISSDESCQVTVTKGVSKRWLRLCDYLKSELTGIKGFDLTVWTTDGSIPWTFQNPKDGDETSRVLRMETEEKWREWEWIKVLLEVKALRYMKITWWESKVNTQEVNKGIIFDSWLAGRMASNRIVRDRMVQEEVVVERSVVVPGLFA